MQIFSINISGAHDKKIDYLGNLKHHIISTETDNKFDDYDIHKLHICML